MSDVTRILDRVQQGESKAADELLPLVYDELRRIVAHKMAQEAPGHTLQPTAPVPEAWLRLVGDGNPQFEGRAHFFAVAAEAMRRILAEAARRKRSLKRGAGASVTDHGSSPVRPTRREFVRWLAAGLCLPWALEEEAISEAALRSPALLAQAATTSAASLAPRTKSDVGSLWPFIQSQAVKGEFPLSWLQPEFKRLETWKRKARGRLLELLHYSPPRCEPRAEVVERVDAGDYVREKVYFNTTPDIRVPAFVLVPKKAKFPAPGIVALHDHGGFYFWGKEKIVESEIEHAVLTDFKKSYYGGKSIASELARQGYVVVVIDMFYWGERRMLLDDDPADWRDRPRDITAERIAEFNRRAGQSEQLVGRTIYSAGFTWPGVMFWDDIRTVDYLLTRPEVDKRRIGCVGLSVGGLRSCHLAALDDRIKAAVVVGWMASFPRQLRRPIRNTIGHTKIVPGLYRYLDYPDVASLAMPKALLVINGSKDGLFDLDGVCASFDKLNACYKKARVPEKCRTRLYATPHEFNAEMQAEAWEWLRRWL